MGERAVGAIAFGAVAACCCCGIHRLISIDLTILLGE
jgi:hypothetical protein